MKPKRRKPMTAAVKSGLRSLAAFVEAGSTADILGYEYEHLGKEQQQDWDDIMRAVRWIWSLPNGERKAKPDSQGG